MVYLMIAPGGTMDEMIMMPADLADLLSVGNRRFFTTSVEL